MVVVAGFGGGGGKFRASAYVGEIACTPKMISALTAPWDPPRGSDNTAVNSAPVFSRELISCFCAGLRSIRATTLLVSSLPRAHFPQVAPAFDPRCAHTRDSLLRKGARVRRRFRCARRPRARRPQRKARARSVCR